MNSHDMKEVITLAIGTIATVLIIIALFTDFFDKPK